MVKLDALSLCHFLKLGERDKSFKLTLINDSIYEREESLVLSIVFPDNQGEVKTATVTITDNEDSTYYIA